MRYNSGMNEASAPRREKLLIAAIVVAAAALRFARLGAQSLWVDEVLSVNAFGAPAGISFWKKLLYDVHGPLYSFFMHFWSMASGGDAWLRVPSAAAGTAAVYLLYRWLRGAAGATVAAAAALFLAVSPFHLYYSQEVRFYSFLALFSVLSLLAYGRFLAAPTGRRGLALGGALALASLSHFSALFLAAGLLAHLAVTRRLRGAHLRAGLLAAAVLVAATAPWVYREATYLRAIRVVDVSGLPVEERLRGERTLSAWQYPYALYAFSTGYSFGPSLRELHEEASARSIASRHAAAIAIAAAVFGTLAVSGVVGLARRRTLSLYLCVFGAAALAATAATALNVKVWNARYLMSVFPLYPALIAFGLPGGATRRLLAAGAACAVMLVADWSYLFDPAYAREDVRSAVAVVESREGPGDAIVVPVVHEVFRHYYRGSNEIALFYPDEIGREGTDARVDDLLRAHGRVWYVRCRSWDRDPDDLLLDAFRRRATPAGTWSFPGVLLLAYGPPPIALAP